MSILKYDILLFYPTYIITVRVCLTFYERIVLKLERLKGSNSSFRQILAGSLWNPL